METDLRHRAVWPTFLWALLAFCLFGVMVVVAVWYFGGGFETYPEKRATQRAEALAKLHEEERQHLEGYAWVDQANGVARIPIARAMELSVAALGKKPVAASSVAVPTPAPPAAPASDEGAVPNAPTGLPVTPETPEAAAGEAATDEAPAAEPAAAEVEPAQDAPAKSEGAAGKADRP